MITRTRNDRGISLVEAIVATSISLVVLLAGASAFLASLSAAHLSVTRTQAAYLEEEGLEAVRALRDNGWNSNIAALATGTPYHLSFSTSTSAWSATTTDTMLGSFERTFTLDSVQRNVAKDIVSSGGTVDSNIRKVTVTVSWADRNGTTSKSLMTYLTNVYSD